jgi:DNA-binding NtrC family response regulator
MAWSLLFNGASLLKDKPMNNKFSILIADRNRNVRNFLEREMTAAGYRVRLAENAREVIKWAFHPDPLDLIILDPDLPDSDDSRVLDVILDRIPAVPVIVHSHLSEYKSDATVMRNVVFVEKRGISVERLKQVVFEMLIGDRHRPPRQAGFGLEPSKQ